MKSVSIRLTSKILNEIEDLDPRSTTGYAERWAMALIGARKMTFVSLKGQFTEEELKFLLDQGNGRNFDSVASLKKETLVFNIQDACLLEELDKKWRIDKDKLVKKFNDMTPLQIYFINDWVDLFWNGKREKTKEDYIQQLLKGK